MIKEEDLLGGERFSILQGYIDMAKFKRDILHEYKERVLREYPSFLDLLERYEEFVINVLGKHGPTMIQ